MSPFQTSKSTSPIRKNTFRSQSPSRSPHKKKKQNSQSDKPKGDNINDQSYYQLFQESATKDVKFKSVNNATSASGYGNSSATGSYLKSHARDAPT